MTRQEIVAELTKKYAERAQINSEIKELQDRLAAVDPAFYALLKEIACS